MSFWYNLGIRAYGLAISLASPIHSKAKKWTSGRKNWAKSLARNTQGKQNWIWFHCSSLGEFEQGRPLIEALKVKYPSHPVLLTFFSPSGYEIRKNYPQADYVCYLPLDTPANAKRFLEIVQPEAAFFIKYDLWLNFLGQIRTQNIPHFLVSALLRPKSQFLKSSLKRHYQKAFKGFNWIFAQDKKTKDLLETQVGTDRVSVCGDSRFDRAMELPAKFEEIPEIRDFVGDHLCIVIGSTYAKDEAVWGPTVEALREFNIRWIAAPHNINPEEIGQKVKQSKGKMGRFSEIASLEDQCELLWIDNIGMLSQLYFYADLVYIGGAFGRNVHNTQEPAVYGNPICFGPNYQNFRETVDMVKMGTAFSVTDSEELIRVWRGLLRNKDKRVELSEKNRKYMREMAGATSKIMHKIKDFLPPA